jgi:hypothetical protein
MRANKTLPLAFTYSQARRAGMSKRALYALRDQGKLELIGRGLFRRRKASLGDPDLVAIAVRAPLGTLCLTTALARHGLVDAIPHSIDIAIPRDQRPHPMRAPVTWHRFDPKTFEIGRGTLALNGGLRIGLYDPMRSIIDAFRLQDLEGPELGREALKRWLKQRGAQPSRLLQMAKAFPRGERPIRAALEILL